VVARTGTHEFGMICPGLSAEHAPPFAERLGDTIRERMNVGSARVVVGAVVGTATSPPLALDATSLTATIDKAMRRDTTIMAWMPDVEL
jgi:GGDEF domain-containing protein